MSVSVNSKVATSFDMASPGDIGGVTPGSGTFTTITTTQDAVINGVTVGSGSGLKNTLVGGGGAGAALLAASGNSVFGYAGGNGQSGATGDGNIVISNGDDDQLWYKPILQPYANSGVWRARDPLFTDYAMLNADEPLYNDVAGFLALSQNRTGAYNVVHGSRAGGSLNPPHGVFTSIVDLGGGNLRFMTSDTTGIGLGEAIVTYRTANYNVVWFVTAVNVNVSFDVSGGTFYTSESGKWTMGFKGFGNILSGEGAAANLIDGSFHVVLGCQAAPSLVHANRCVVIGNFVDVPSDTDNQIVIGTSGVVALAFDANHWHFKKPVKRNVTTYSAASSNISIDDDVIYLDAASNNVDVVLPPANTFGVGFTKTFRIRRTDTSANSVTITPNGTETINGAAVPVSILTGWYLDLEVNATGDGWYVF